MICRWCGEKVDPKEKMCPACGHEMPPLSDCGGYIGITAPTAQGISEQPHIKSAKIARGNDGERHNWKPFFSGVAILYIVLVVFLIAIVTLLASEKVTINKLSDTLTTEMNKATTVQGQIISGISQLHQNQKAMEDKLVSMISSDQSVSSAPTSQEPVAPVSLETQNIKFELRVDDQQRWLLASVDLDGYSVPISVLQDDSTGEFQCVIGKDKETLLWTVSSVLKDNEYDSPHSLSYLLTAALSYGSSPQIDWEYRYSDSENWNDVKEAPEFFTARESALAVNWETSSLNHISETIQTKCIYRFDNESGGSLELSLLKDLQATTGESNSSEPVINTNKAENGGY